jgi:hypothetical protein
MKIFWTGLVISIACSVAAPSMFAAPEVGALVGPSSAPVTAMLPARSEAAYTRPTEREKAGSYVWNAYGPLPLATAGVASAYGQWTNSPPQWGQGAASYGKRFGSEFGMAATTTTTRYALSEALREDPLYYRSECRGIFGRLGHAVISTVTARRGQSGRRTFSLPALVAPYAGSTVAVYGWYPDRYGAKDSFRIGNYNLLALVGGNVAMEFLYSGPHSLLSRVQLNSRRASSDPGPNR